MTTYAVAVAGATGYAGQEALRILSGHPNMHISHITGHSSVGDRLGAHAPHLAPLAAMTIEQTDAGVLADSDIVILALPHGASGALAKDLEDVPVVVDLGADHRLEREADWDAFYDGAFSEHWTYGMPELINGVGTEGALMRQRDQLAHAARIAGPGCNVTAVTLAIQPAIAAGLIDPHNIVADVVVGYSGAGKSLKHTRLLAAEALGSATAYSVGGVHRHIPEILQNFGHSEGRGAGGADDFTLGFTPILAPMARGIFASVSAGMNDRALAMDDGELREVWRRAYDGQMFVDLLEPGAIPAVQNVIGSNAAHVQVVADRRAGRLLAMCVIDNLNKGTAGQAIQSLNIALGLPEDTGLSRMGIAP